MKIFWSQQRFNDYVRKRIIEDRHEFMQATARNAAANALHHYVVFRSFEWMRASLDKAEKEGDKYISLAKLFAQVQKENMHE